MDREGGDDRERERGRWEGQRGRWEGQRGRC